MSAPTLQIAVGEIAPRITPTAPSAAASAPMLAAGVAAPGERQEPLPGAGLPRPRVLEVLAGDVEPGDRLHHSDGRVREVATVWARRGVVTFELAGRWSTRWTVAADHLVEVVR